MAKNTLLPPLLQELYELQTQIKSLEARAKELREQTRPLLTNVERLVYPAEDGNFILQLVRQDRRKPDEKKLAALLRQHNFTNAFREVPDEEKVAELLESGLLPMEQFSGTLSGKIVTYPLLTFRREGEEED